MKTLILLLSSLLMSMSISSQNILDPKNSWNFLEVRIPICKKSSMCEGKSFENHGYFISNDTVINEKKYKTIMQITIKSNDNSSNSSIYGFLRDDESHKKFYYLPYMAVTPEILLYDYTLKENDVFTNPQFSSKVTKIDSVFVNGNKRLRIQFDNIKINWIGDVPINDTTEWIEGIGSRQGLVDYFYYRHILICFEQNNQIIYSNSYGYDCSYSGPKDGIQSNNMLNMRIFPNPATELLNIQSDEIINNIVLYEITGKLVRTYSPKSSQYQIDLTAIKKGLYFIKIDNDIKKLIKE